jgi:hypothetical protein
MTLKKLIALVILLIFLVTCKTFVIELESPKDFKKDYKKCETDKDLHKVNAEKIIELNRIIDILWIQITGADKKNITVIDFRNEKDKQKTR